MASASVLSYVDEDDRCLHCQTQSLHIDWAAGDRVCTNCGVVHEEHLRDDRPEWREFNDDNDRAKGGPAMARCGAVVDEARYVGGLEPTSISRTIFGGSSGGPSSSSGAPSGILVRKKLIRASRKIDSLIDRHRKDALNTAKVGLKLRKRRLSSNILGDTETDFTEDEVQEENDDKYFLPEHEQLLIQEEEDAHRAQEALNSDRWSLERAILLHGTEHEQISKHHNDPHHPFDREAERDELLQRLDKPMKQSAADLYQAYSMLTYGFRKLLLPERVLHEATTMLCKYASRKDGFSVKGVSTRLSTNTNREDKKPSTKEDKEAIERLREFNKSKQMASLGSALLYLTARNLGWARPLPEVCSSFHQTNNDANTNKTDTTGTAIKAKHCWKAIKEVKTLFPNYVRPVPIPAATAVRKTATSANRGTSGAISDIASTGNFVDYATRKLDLPPVAVASIRSLVAHCRKEQIEKGIDSGTKLSTICASVTYFICSAGATMQKLAQQAESSRSAVPIASHVSSLHSDRPTKKQKTEPKPVKEEEKPEIVTSVPNSSSAFDCDGSSVVSETSSSSTSSDINIKQEAFDVFSHAPVDEDPAAKQEYEARRIWDAWSEQMPWSRNIGVVEQSCGVSQKFITEHYKRQLYPQRQQLLGFLKNIVSEGSTVREEYAQSVREAPLSSVLLGNITSAAALISNKVK